MYLCSSVRKAYGTSINRRSEDGTGSAYVEFLEIIGSTGPLATLEEEEDMTSLNDDMEALDIRNSKTCGSSHLHKRRRSSVPFFFPTQALSDDEHAEDDGGEWSRKLKSKDSIPIEQPVLCKTPRPLKVATHRLSTDGRLFTAASPIHRTRNPLPLNSPFERNRRTRFHESTSPYSREDRLVEKRQATVSARVELGLLSPSPSPSSGKNFEIQHHNFDTERTDPNVPLFRSRSKSLADIDPKRLSFLLSSLRF
ncbi:hypothetical protein HK102_009193 [Quaeritorhiza haematococci]|nr:hypothetical protein HK102_009193 [Quaeritorhiza haematococci]